MRPNHFSPHAIHDTPPSTRRHVSPHDRHSRTTSTSIYGVVHYCTLITVMDLGEPRVCMTILHRIALVSIRRDHLITMPAVGFFHTPDRGVSYPTQLLPQPWKKIGGKRLSLHLPSTSLRPNLELGDREAFLGVQEALEQCRLRCGLAPHGKDGGRRQLRRHKTGAHK